MDGGRWEFTADLGFIEDLGWDFRLVRIDLSQFGLAKTIRFFLENLCNLK